MPLAAAAAKLGAPSRRVASLVGFSLWVSACASAPSYERGLSEVHQALDRGDSLAARAALEAKLAREGSGAPEAALWRLELATVAIEQADLAEAARILEEADPLLEVVDLSRDEEGELASWIFADAARPYRSPPYEKLMVNLLGLSSRLAIGDARGALVEARRLSVLDAFFRDAGSDPGQVLGLGLFLAELACRVAGRPREGRSFRARAERARPELYQRPWWSTLLPRGELVIVTLRGRVPRKAERTLSAAEVARRGGLATEAGALERAGVKELRVVELGEAPPAHAPALISVDGAPVPWSVTTDLAATARRSFAIAEPALARAAVTRALSRRAARRGIASLETLFANPRVAGPLGSRPISCRANPLNWRCQSCGSARRDLDQPPSGPLGPGHRITSLDGRSVPKGRVSLGGLLGGLVAGAMSLGDVLDTRCWSGLPSSIEVTRLWLPPGRHRVELGGAGVAREVAVDRERPTLVLLVASKSKP